NNVIEPCFESRRELLLVCADSVCEVLLHIKLHDADTSMFSSSRSLSVWCTQASFPSWNLVRKLRNEMLQQKPRYPDERLRPDQAQPFLSHLSRPRPSLFLPCSARVAGRWERVGWTASSRLAYVGRLARADHV